MVKAGGGGGGGTIRFGCRAVCILAASIIQCNRLKAGLSEGKPYSCYGPDIVRFVILSPYAMEQLHQLSPYKYYEN
jgi:hypothetical protein